MAKKPDALEDPNATHEEIMAALRARAEAGHGESAPDLDEEDEKILDKVWDSVPPDPELGED